jgi:hypothetical protein
LIRYRWPEAPHIVLKCNRENPYNKERTQRNTLSLIHSACMLFNRRSRIFLRHSLIIAPLLSLNGVLGMSLFCRLSPNWNRLLLIALPLRIWAIIRALLVHYRTNKTPSPGIASSLTVPGSHLGRIAATANAKVFILTAALTLHTAIRRP